MVGPHEAAHIWSRQFQTDAFLWVECYEDADESLNPEVSILEPVASGSTRFLLSRCQQAMFLKLAASSGWVFKGQQWPTSLLPSPLPSEAGKQSSSCSWYHTPACDLSFPWQMAPVSWTIPQRLSFQNFQFPHCPWRIFSQASVPVRNEVLVPFIAHKSTTSDFPHWSLC